MPYIRLRTRSQNQLRLCPLGRTSELDQRVTLHPAHGNPTPSFMSSIITKCVSQGNNQPSAACVCPHHIGFPYQAWVRLMFNAKRNRVLGWFAANVSLPGCSSLLCYKDLFTIAPTSRIRRSRCNPDRALCSQTCSLLFSSPCDAHGWSVWLRFATTTGVYFRTRASGSRVCLQR
jgi:hypothetical protein